jgi:hypothetical protein
VDIGGERRYLMLRTLMSLVAVATLATVVIEKTAVASPPIRRAEKIVVRDTVRVPYMAGKVEVRLMPGAPFVLELPPRETARNIWVDNRWWKAQPVVKAGSGRARVSGRVHDERESGKEAQVVITRTKPLEVMVGFDRYQIDRSGAATELGHVFLRAHLKEVPRSPANPAELMIVDTEMSERL